jgi:carboxyl-terminal processing protease
MHVMAVASCPTILLTALPALNMGSIIPMTSGMEPGVAHPLYKMAGMFVMGVPGVLLNGLPAVTLTSPTMGNAGNNPVGVVVASSVVNVLFARAPVSEAAIQDDIAPPVGRGDWVRVARFDCEGAAGLRAAMARARGAVTLDLRGNPGGEVEVCLDLLRNLLPAGAVMATLVDNEGDSITYRARGDLYGTRLTILVDKGTASAAELFAGSLQAHRRARIVGERTYGKAIVSAQVSGGETGQVARFVLPDARDIQGIGLEPDVV